MARADKAVEIVVKPQDRVELVWKSETNYNSSQAETKSYYDIVINNNLSGKIIADKESELQIKGELSTPLSVRTTGAFAPMINNKTAVPIEVQGSFINSGGSFRIDATPKEFFNVSTKQESGKQRTIHLVQHSTPPYINPQKGKRDHDTRFAEGDLVVRYEKQGVDRAIGIRNNGVAKDTRIINKQDHNALLLAPDHGRYNERQYFNQSIVYIEQIKKTLSAKANEAGEELANDEKNFNLQKANLGLPIYLKKANVIEEVPELNSNAMRAGAMLLKATYAYHVRYGKLLNEHKNMFEADMAIVDRVAEGLSKDPRPPFVQVQNDLNIVFTRLEKTHTDFFARPDIITSQVPAVAALKEEMQASLTDLKTIRSQFNKLTELERENASEKQKYQMKREEALSAVDPDIKELFMRDAASYVLKNITDISTQQGGFIKQVRLTDAVQKLQLNAQSIISERPTADKNEKLHVQLNGIISVLQKHLNNPLTSEQEKQDTQKLYESLRKVKANLNKIPGFQDSETRVNVSKNIIDTLNFPKLATLDADQSELRVMNLPFKISSKKEVA